MILFNLKNELNLIFFFARAQLITQNEKTVENLKAGW